MNARHDDPQIADVPNPGRFNLASTDKYEDSILPTGSFVGSPEEALDCACGLYLATPDI
ncbi:hypothetical protein [Streptomyces sp. NBC_00842]|uniref:hypothetical protein n=1 Tax=Streptomyces sp. NBC_00842 TaxID=2975848 RepID=UPI0038645E16|nr:hypothetical protein OH821_32675 [Streptomyces sp. NBC_00842]